MGKSENHCMKLVGMKSGTADQKNGPVVSRVVREHYSLAQQFHSYFMLKALETDNHTDAGSYTFPTTLRTSTQCVASNGC